MLLRSFGGSAVVYLRSFGAIHRGQQLAKQVASKQPCPTEGKALSQSPIQLCLPFPLAHSVAMATISPTAEPATQNPPGIAQPSGKDTPKKTDRVIVFVLGGPGSGKGTQCAKLVEEFGIVHLSAGDLLRAHMKSGTPDGNMVADMIKQGTIVPSHVTISLLERAMDESKKTKFLIDGFPRNEENRSSFERQEVRKLNASLIAHHILARKTGEQPFFILFFDCPEEVMEKRLLGRSEGRTDDNIETIRKRFKVFKDSSMPVVDHYDKQGKVYKFDSTRTPDQIYSHVRELFLDL